MILTFIEPHEGADKHLLGDWAAAFEAAVRDPGVTGVIFLLSGGHQQAPELASPLGQFCRLVEQCPKPVMAAMSGKMGGAVWAIGLAAHARIASPSFKAVMPEARFGLMPAAGVTQRLPRLVGAADALRMMLETRPEDAISLQRLGVIDIVDQDDPIAASVKFLASPEKARRTCDVRAGFAAPKDYLAAVRSILDLTAQNAVDAATAIALSVEAALLLPFDEGLALETVLLRDLAHAPMTLALRHALAAETAVRMRLRQVAAFAKPVSKAPLGRLGLWRAGPERAELVLGALRAGMQVTVCGAEAKEYEVLVARIDILLEVEVARGAITRQVRDVDRSRLATGHGHGPLQALDLVLAAQNDLPELAAPVVALTHNAGSFAGFARLYLPRGASGYAEISLPETEQAPAALLRLLELVRKLGWRTQVCGAAGFIEPALRRALRLVAARLSEMGHDGAVLSAGMAAAGIGASQAGKTQPVSGAIADVAHLALAAIANEGARLIENGTAQSALDVDAAAVSCGISPRAMGGPMYQANLRGLILLRSDLQKLGPVAGLEPAPLIERLISQGTSLLAELSPA